MAQLGARHTGSVEVTGSNPVCSIFYAQARTEEHAVKAVCGPRGEQGEKASLLVYEVLE